MEPEEYKNQDEAVKKLLEAIKKDRKLLSDKNNREELLSILRTTEAVYRSGNGDAPGEFSRWGLSFFYAVTKDFLDRHGLKGDFLERLAEIRVEHDKMKRELDA